MARSRRGSFGLQPRVAPNVTGQIIALAREYVAKRDALIMDAWRNGGTFEGKKATDDMVLKYWQERQKGLDKNDPDYEAAKNNVMQLQYGIEQSKADVLHVQGKMSDTEYAQFFLKWAKKVPANSEFYRTLQKDAAQLIESAKERARVNGERAKTEAFNAFVKTTTAKDIAIGDQLTRALSSLSSRTGLNITANGDELLAMLTADVKANPASYRALTDAIRAGDPHFDGNYTEAYFAQHIKQATDGYNLIADRAQKAGFVSAYASATEGMASMSNWGQNLKVWPVAQSYSQIENTFLKVWNDPNASQMDKMAAAEAASAQFSKLASSDGIDAGSRTMIEADAQRLLGQDAGDNPSFGTAMLNRPGVDPKMTMQLGAWAQTKAEMLANPLAWAYGPVDANGQYDPTGKGPLGMVPAGSVPPGAQAVMVPGADGKAVMAMVSPHMVYTQDPNNPNASPQLAGFQINYNVGGKTIQLWGYKDAHGATHWSLTSPLVDKATVQTDSKGDIFVSPPATAATDPIARAKQLDAKLGTHVAEQLQAQLDQGVPLGNVTVTKNHFDKDGHVDASLEVTYNNGTFTATQKTNSLDKDGHVLSTQSTPLNIAVSTPEGTAFSASRLAAGDVAGVTFNSALQASVKAASYTQTQDQVSKFASDPAFQQAFLSQTMQTLGITNPFDPRIAAAWKDVTTATRPDVPTARTPQNAALRADLRYPGEEANPAAFDKQINVRFGQNELTVPGLPSYLQNQQVNVGLGSSAANWATSAPWASLLPGLGAPPQQPQGSPTPTVTPTPTPTNTTTGVTPTTLPGPSPTPTPTSPTPAPPTPPKPGLKPS